MRRRERLGEGRYTGASSNLSGENQSGALELYVEIRNLRLVLVIASLS